VEDENRGLAAGRTSCQRFTSWMKTVAVLVNVSIELPDAITGQVFALSFGLYAR
jgi:hypothetical protein